MALLKLNIMNLFFFNFKKIKKLIQFYLIFILLSLICIWAEAQDRPWLLSKGNSAREAKRFNLYDFMAEKNRQKVMDMWLVYNSPSPYEFMLGGSLLQGVTEKSNQSSTSYKSYEAEVHAYASLVGLSAEYQNNSEEKYNETTGQFNLRLFGDSIQGSQLTLNYGLRTRQDNNQTYRLNQTFWGGTLEIYMLKNFGLHSHYRNFNRTSESYFGISTGYYIQYGVFIDYGPLRINGSVFEDQLNSNLNSVESTLAKNGSKISLQLFF